MTYFINNHTEKTSQPISINDIPEAAGISNEEFANAYNGDINELNKDLYEFDFSTTPKY
ncbi:MAG: hypothetical protein KDD04_10175 [Sinomicrobium sp.]|nr:hypothetical protein [Sinomicrobium sp.]